MHTSKILTGISVAFVLVISGCGGGSETNFDTSTDGSTVDNNNLPNTADTIVSSITGRTWMSKNLGASRVCTAINDKKCYGDYYQWGRGADGHEKVNSTTTSTKSSSALHSNKKFVLSTSADNWEWTTADSNRSVRSEYWDVCPNGFRVPTELELDAENFSDNFDAFNILKIPSAGYRDGSDATLKNQGRFAYIPSSTDTTGQTASSNDWKFGVTGTYAPSPSYGLPVRCIKSDTKFVDHNLSYQVTKDISYLDSNSPLRYPPKSIKIVNDYAYLTSDEFRGFSIFHISNNNFTEIANVSSSKKIYDLQVQGNYVYALSSDGLSIIDISDPYNPVQKSQISSYGGVSLDISNTRAYIEEGYNLQIIDISDPLNPIEIAHPYLQSKWGRTIEINSNYLSSATGNGIKIKDISDPLNPLPIDIDTHTAVSLKIVGNYIYIWAYNSRNTSYLDVVDITHPNNPIFIKSFRIAILGYIDMISLEISSERQTARMKITNNNLYMFSQSTKEIIKVNIANPVNPQFIGTYHVTEIDGDIEKVGDYIYTTHRKQGLKILELN